MIACDEIKTVMEVISTKLANTMAKNVESTASENYYSKKVRDCYTFHTVLIQWYHYWWLSLCKRKGANSLTI